MIKNKTKKFNRLHLINWKIFFQLERKVLLSKFVSVIPLYKYNPAPDTHVLVAGWGSESVGRKDKDFSMSYRLKVMWATTIENSECQHKFKKSNFSILPTHICAYPDYFGENINLVNIYMHSTKIGRYFFEYSKLF